MPLPLIIAGVGALAGIAGNIYASNRAGKARREQQAMIDAENQRNESWFNSEYNKSQLDRTENAHALQKAQEFFRDRANMDAKTAAVTGATPESVAASRKSYANAYSNMVGQIASGASAERDRIRARYEANRQNIFGMKYGMYGDQVEQYGNLGSNSASLATNSAMSLANGLVDKYKNRKSGNYNPVAAYSNTMNENIANSDRDYEGWLLDNKR